jgi:hypothetical protein
MVSGKGAPVRPTESPGPEQTRPRYDQSLKRLLSRAHDDFLRLIAPGFTWQAEHSPELPAASRQADLVWEVTDTAGERGLLHVELQTKPDKQMGERVAEYGIRLWLREHLPVRTVVVFLQPARSLPTSPFVIAWSGWETLRYAYDVVHLWEIPAERVLASATYDLWPLAALMDDVTLDRAVAVAERLAAAPLPEHERSELAALLVALSDLRLERGALREALRRLPMIDDILRQSSLAEEFLAEGIAQGVAQGVAQGERRMAQAALEGRFGTLDADLLAALDTADEATLQTLMAHIATDTLEQVRSRLGLQ